MRNKDKESLARFLRGQSGLIGVPLVRPLSDSWTDPPEMMAECHTCGLDFYRKIVRLPVAELTFDEVRRLWEAIMLYNEVA